MGYSKYIWIVCYLSILFIFLNSVQSRSTEWNPKKDLYIIQKCNRSQPIQLSELNEFLVTKRWSGLSGRNFKCFLNCLYINYEWMNGGEFIIENMHAILTETDLLNPFIAEMVLEKCTNLHFTNPCERAFQFTQCFWLETKHLHQKEYSRNYYDEEKK